MVVQSVAPTAVQKVVHSVVLMVVPTVAQLVVHSVVLKAVQSVVETVVPKVVRWATTMVVMVPVWGLKSVLRVTITAAIMCVSPTVFAPTVSTMMV